MKKELCKIFKDNGSSITNEANKKSVNYLDLTLDLETDSFKPYIKPNDNPVYVHMQSDHPPNILKNIPKSVNTRLSSISSNEEIFEQAKGKYQEALKSSGYNFDLKFQPPDLSKKKNNRGRVITYFNPPYSVSVKTNIGEKFLKLVTKCFPKEHPLSKIINRNTVKVSYKCMPNLSKAISRHNQTQLKKEKEEEGIGLGCNCQNHPCPLETQNCQTNQVIYRATVTDEDNKVNTYTGLTRNTFKKRFNGHTYTFNHRDAPSTTLSSHVWNLKDQNKNFEINWKLVDRATDFNPTTRKCRLCLKEKFYIIFQPEGASLNKRSELFSACRHRLRLLLENT